MNTNSVMQSQECGLVNKNSLISIKNWSKKHLTGFVKVDKIGLWRALI